MKLFAQTEAEKLFLYHACSLLFGEKADEILTSVTAQEKEGGILASIRLEEKETKAFVPIDTKKHFEEKRARSAALGKALFCAAREISFCRRIPYGTLVGVKPVKIASFYSERGLLPEETKRILEEEYFVLPEKAALLIDLAQKENSVIFDRKDALLYISVPFCPSRCRYCSFVSASIAGKESLVAPYLERMHEEMKLASSLFREKKLRLRAVYIGGGTPGVLSAKEMEKLIDDLKNSFPFEENTEFTCEIGRPDTVTKEKLIALKNGGAGRICINPQTTDDKVLARIGRNHTAKDYFSAVELAKKIGFDCINSDLIAGLWGDSAEGFLRSVKDVLSLGVENITIHALCHKNAAEEAALPQTQGLAFAMDKAIEACIKEGFAPYYLYRQKNAVENLENIGFEKGGKPCLYNIGEMGDLCTTVALGAGASTKILPLKTGEKIHRFYTFKYPYEYLRGKEKIMQNYKAISQLL